MEIVTIKGKRSHGKYLAPGLGLLIVLLAGYILLNRSPPVQPPIQNNDTTKAASPIAEPVASIAVLPFADMENDISIQVAELLSSTPAIHIIAFDELNKNKVQARFSLQAVQASNRLVVSLFDNIQQQTRLNVEIDLLFKCSPS